jgi:CelD/BcsL family acetyltransferase involved in cellulose biosynthesis
MNFEIKIFSEINDELKKSWQEFEGLSYGYCFQSFDWFETWFEIFRAKNKEYLLQVVVVKISSKIICILPFEIKKKNSLNYLNWVGDQHSDYCSPLISKDFIFNSKNFTDLFNKILKKINKIDIIFLTKQPHQIDQINNPFVSFLKNYQDSKTFSILLPDNWNNYNKKVLKKEFYLQNVRKKKNLKKEGLLNFKRFEISKNSSEIIDKLFTQKNLRLTSQGMNTLSTNNLLKFYQELTIKKNKYIQIHLSALTFNTELVGIHWGIIYRKRFYYLLLSMNQEKLKKYSPGRLLISFLIRWSISKKLKIFDFTLGEETYKRSWSNNTNYLFNHVSSYSMIGLLVLPFLKLKIYIKHLDTNGQLRKVFKILKNKFN